MAFDCIRSDSDQVFLLPPNTRDWLPEGHLTWEIIKVVDTLGLSAFLAGYRHADHATIARFAIAARRGAQAAVRAGARGVRSRRPAAGRPGRRRRHEGEGQRL